VSLSFAALSRPRRGEGKEASAGEIGRVIAALEELNRTTEADFLSVGGKLMQFLSASKNLHADIAGLASLVSGDDAQRACGALDSVRRYAREMERRSEQSGRALSTLRAGADRIRRAFSTFGKIAVSFRITAILARMEAAWLTNSEQNLKNLADDVRSSSDSIGACADQVLDAAAEFDSRIASALPAVARFEAIRLRDLPRLLAEVDADVQVFQERRREAEKTSASLAVALEAVTRDLGALAGALQFHDITRQQLEHVVEALRELPRDNSERGLSSRAGAPIRLQKAQIESAATAFAASTRKVDRDLDAIAEQVAEMAGAAPGIAGGKGTGDDASFWVEIQHRFSGVAQAVSELESLEGGTLATVADLRRTTGGLDEVVDKVRAIERQLGHISINAVISASHIGPQGEALKVIADAIRDLRGESAERSGAAKEALASIGEAIVVLNASGSREAGENSGAALAADLNAGAASLRGASESAAGAAVKVARCADALCSDLKKARRDFTVGRTFAEAAERCCAALDGIAEEIDPGGGSVADMRALSAKIEDRYTMQSERDVHRGATAGPAAAAAHEQEEVEFF
jgi:hypothetical protein